MALGIGFTSLGLKHQLQVTVLLSLDMLRHPTRNVIDNGGQGYMIT